VVGGNERSELRERRIAIAGGHVTKNLVVSPIFLDHIDDVLDRVTPAENQRSFSGFAFLISIPTIIGRHPAVVRIELPFAWQRNDGNATHKLMGVLPAGIARVGNQ